MNKIKQILAILIMVSLLLVRGGVWVYADAEEAQPAGEAQTAGEAQAPKEDKEDKPPKEAEEATPAQEATTPPSDELATESETQGVVPQEGNGYVGTSNDGNVGDTLVATGDANNTGAVYNTANSNLAASGCCAEGSGVSIANTNNGANSSNDGSATIVNDNNTDQDNSAVILNDVNQTSITGNNSASMNLGDSSIVTGDANTSATVITAANTNVSGVQVSEFNIVDDHFGDYILDFNAGCVSGCGAGDTSIANTNNGAGSDNSGSANITTNNNIDQSNDGVVTNNIDLLADSGNNTANKNNGGDVNITTGDANVAANLLTFLNNNIAGGVVFGVVNIFGDLVGDIILPDNVFDQFACGGCGGDVNIENSNNGAYSDNKALVNDTTNNNVFQANDATIENNLYLEAETGNNTASKNNQGDVNIQTGQSLVDASILNIANMNILGSNMWLIIINEAGNWVGKLFGATEADYLAGSEGVEFAINPNGVIDVTNSNNGAFSTNNGEVNNTTNNNINQTNNAQVVNNLNLSANTGGNEANKNNGGDVNITTGDAQAIANIVNFVNNNIAGGKLLVTFVNVFGSWTGDFLTPGSHKEESAVLAQGGVGDNNSPSNENNSQNNSINSNTPNSAVSQGPNVVAAAGFFGGSNSLSNTTTADSDVQIAGFNNNNADILSGLTKGIADKDKKMNINLAWLLLTTPVLALGILARKRFIKKSA